MSRLGIARTSFGLAFALAGALHFVIPAAYRAIVPSYLPHPAALVAISGAAEIAGGLGLLVPRLRRAAGIGLVLLLVAVFPANVEMLRQARASGASGWAQGALWLRLPVQAVLLYWAWRLSRPQASLRSAKSTTRPSATID